ncbi:hypothetical protein EB093_08850 [bacterium]|nr:hypothetical protein [bacterium]
MTYRAEFLIPNVDEYVQIGGDFVTPIDAIRLCYDLKNRRPYITDYRVVSSEGRIVFSRGKSLTATPQELLN